MKRTIAVIMTLMIAACLLVACGGKSYVEDSISPSSPSGNTSSGYATRPDGGGEAVADMDYAYEKEYDYSTSTQGAAPPTAAPMPEAPEESYDDAAGTAVTAVTDVPIVPKGGDGFAEKIIYSVSADIETVDFDAAVEGVYKLLDKYGAFIESSYVGGRNYAQTYHGYQSYRSARFVIRVPNTRLTEASKSLDALGNVTSLSSDAQNITSQYYDTQSRLTAYRTEETRLLEMLGKAETVADMIVVETRLSEVRYQVEALTTTLRNWQNQVDYSTMTIHIGEVEKLTDIQPVQRPYFVRMTDGIKTTFSDIGEFFKDLFMWLAVNSPVLVILAAIAVIVALIVRKRVRKAKNSKKPDQSEE